MAKSKELRLYVETVAESGKKIKRELNAIGRAKAKQLKADSISFQSLSQLRKFLTPKRLELLKIIKHKNPKSIYELAKMAGRTPENVNTDVKFLKRLGFVQTTKVKEVRKKLVPEVDYDRMILEIDV